MPLRRKISIEFAALLLIGLASVPTPLRAQAPRPVGFLAWRPSPVSAGIAMIMFVVVVLNIGRVSEFLYYQF